MLSVVDSPITGNNCFNVHITKAFVVGAGKGIYAENVGDGDENGIHIGMVYGRNNDVCAVELKNCNGGSVGIDSRLDEVGVILSGTTSAVRVFGNIQEAASEGVKVGASVGTDVDLSGLRVRNCNMSATGGRGQIKIETTAFIRTSDLVVETTSSLSDYLIDVVAGNDLQMLNGRLAMSGGVSMFNNSPQVARNVKGFKTENGGNATILSGSQTVTVNHGLHATPLVASPTGRGSETADVYISARSPTTITIAATSAVTANRTVDWVAQTGSYY
jgi:hypothetical protein